MGIEAIATILMLAVLAEGIIEVVKSWVPEGTIAPGWLWPVTSAVLGVFLCVLSNVDVLSIAGVSLNVPIVGSIFTGVLISRGASFVHDLWSRMKA